MAKKKISGLPAGSALNGTELVPIVQAGTTKRTTAQDIANLGSASGVSGSGTINRLPKFTASSAIGDSKFFDDGTNQGTETTTAINRFIMSANASIAKIFSFRSGNLPRWAFRVDGTESGANAGADLAIRRYNDAGTYIDSPMTMDRSDGTISVLKDATINQIIVGKGAGDFVNNTKVGYLNFNFNTTGINNSSLGYGTLYQNTTGSQNTAMGVSALENNLTGSNNIAIGFTTLFANTASNNTAIGAEAASSNTSGSEITAIGYASLKNNTTGAGNTSIGYSTLNSNTTGSQNTAIGNQSLRFTTTGTENTAIGSASLYTNITGSNNTAIGRLALFANTIASENTAIGFESSYSIVDSNGSVAVGYRALKANLSGYNTAVGWSCLSANITGNNLVAIGANQQSGNFEQTSMIGVADTATGNNQMRFGSSAIINGAVATEVNLSSKVWNVFINGVAQKILLA